MKCRKETHLLEHEGGAFGAHGNVPEGICQVNFVGQLLEGKPDMSPIHKQTRGFVIAAKRIVLHGFLTVLMVVNVCAQNAQQVPDVTKMSVEDLMNMQVTSVSKHTQKVADAAAAIFVLTQEDIRRSGATSIPDALRLVPGLEVARIDENKWAIGSRGFNGRFDNKLLVLIDGRSVYTPLFSGVYWNIQDVMLEDLDRIEVIRGPGATLWGANAVDGVINIITKPAGSTQSAIVTAGGGTEERGSAGARTRGLGGCAGHGGLGLVADVWLALQQRCTCVRYL